MKFTKLAAAITLGLALSAAHAAAVDKTFNVKINITGTCVASAFSGATVSDIDFGDVSENPSNSELTQNNGTANTLTLQCSNGSVFKVGLRPASSTLGASTGVGSMKNGPNSIAYTLKQPTLSGTTYTAGTAASDNWGDIDPTNTLAVTGQGLTTAIKLPVAAVIAANSLGVPVGAYTEVVTATLTY